MIAIHITVGTAKVSINIDENSTFLDFIMAVQTACQRSTQNSRQNDLPAPAQYLAADGRPYDLRQLGMRLQDLGFKHNMQLQTSYSVFLEKNTEDLSVENLRRRTVDIILGSLALEIAKQAAQLDADYNAPETCALLALFYQHRLISRAQAQSIIAHIQSRYANKPVPLNSPEYTVYTMLELLVADTNKELEETHPEEKLNVMASRTFSDELPEVICDLTADYAVTLGELEGIFASKAEAINYIDKQCERLAKLSFPEAWDELPDGEKDTFLQEHLKDKPEWWELARKLPDIKRAPNRYLQQAACSGDIRLFKLALKFGADINYFPGSHYDLYQYDNPNISKENVLVLASYYGHPDIVREILTNQTFNSDAVHFDAALRGAAITGQTRVIKLLLTRLETSPTRSGVNQKKALASSIGGALITAVQNNRKETVELLLAQKDTDVNYKQPMEFGHSPLTEACRFGLKEMAELLLDYGAVIDQRDDDKSSTPLMIAVDQNHSEVIRMLLERGADITLRNSSGNTALDVARNQNSNKYAEIIGLLEQHQQKVGKEEAKKPPSSGNTCSSGMFGRRPSVPSTSTANLQPTTQGTRDRQVAQRKRNDGGDDSEKGSNNKGSNNKCIIS